jgi:hypothetical protein
MLADPNGKPVGSFGQIREIKQGRSARRDMVWLRNSAQARTQQRCDMVDRLVSARAVNDKVVTQPRR